MSHPNLPTVSIQEGTGWASQRVVNLNVGNVIQQLTQLSRRKCSIFQIITLTMALKV